MGTYPLNPWVYVVSVVGLMVLSSLAEAGPASSFQTVAMYAPGFAFLLQYFWSWQVLRFITGVSDSAKKYMKRFKILVMVAATGMTLLAIVTFIRGAPIEQDNNLANILNLVFGQIVVVTALAVFWNPAAALCVAEDGMDTPASRIVGTFLLFLVLIVGAPFIFRRLEALGERKSGALGFGNS